MGKDVPQEEAADHPLPAAGRHRLIQLPARRLDEGTHLHAGRAGRFTGAAIEALKNRVVQSLIQRDPPFARCLDQMDPSPRRLVFQLFHLIGGTGVETHPAVNADRPFLLVRGIRIRIAGDRSHFTSLPQSVPD